MLSEHPVNRTLLHPLLDTCRQQLTQADITPRLRTVLVDSGRACLSSPELRPAATDRISWRPAGAVRITVQITRAVARARRTERTSDPAVSTLIRVSGTPCWGAAVVTLGERLGSATLPAFAHTAESGSSLV
jgi:hypothetical protein